MNVIQKIASAAVLACVAAGASAAQPTPFYAEASVGPSHFNNQCDAGDNCDNSDLGFRAAGGFRFDDMLGVEGGYLDFGKYTIQATGLSGSIKSGGPYVAGTYRVAAMPKLDLTAKLGAYYGMTKTSCGGSQCAFSSRKDNKLKPLFGIGVHYELIRGLSVGGSVDLTQGEVNGESGSLSMLGASVRYAF